VLDEEGLQANAKVVGAALGEALGRLHQKYELIGDVRGRGLMKAMELVRDRGTKEPAVAETAAIFERTREAGIVVSKSGANRNILRMVPPLCLSLDDIPKVEAALDDCFAAVTAA
jgi:alanine-glyoxylate transaminase/(R)-3-amino-2-methylpropionate-pyruvate transaminase